MTKVLPDGTGDRRIQVGQDGKRSDMSQVIVVGGGAAGMMAAYACAASGHQVVLLEKNKKLGKKIYITGKGRCNVTNSADKEQFFRNIVSNSKFLYSSIYRFDNLAMMSFLEEYGCPVKTERGGRVFPVSDHASDVTAALHRALQEMYVDIRLKTEVKGLMAQKGKPMAMERTEAEKVLISLEEPQEKSREEKEVDALSQKRGEAEEVADTMPQKRTKDERSVRQVRGVYLSDGRKLEADAVILACGGLSYPTTGSDGAGFKLAAQAGHSLVPCQPALVPFEVKERWCKRLQGLSLKNVEVRLFAEADTQRNKDGKTPEMEGVFDKSKLLYSGFGEMLFTHFGVSGPLMLSASSYYAKAVSRTKFGDGEKPGMKKDGAEEDAAVGVKSRKRARLLLNLKPAMDEEMLDKRILRDFEENSHKAFKNALGGLFPAKLIPVMVELSGIDGEKKVYDVTREERRAFVHLIRNLPLTVTGTRGFEEAVITQGGIPVSEVNPSTMESKLCDGLYFAGEMLDIDALTGGYNLQLAWSTGHLAGASVKF